MKISPECAGTLCKHWTGRPIFAIFALISNDCFMFVKI